MNGRKNAMNEDGSGGARKRHVIKDVKEVKEGKEIRGNGRRLNVT